MEPVELLRSIASVLERGESTLGWALVHARAGDPLGEAWAQCDDTELMLSLSARVDRAETASALARCAVHEAAYPHARDCLLSAARDVREGRIREAESWVNSAIVHYPGRGTARPMPDKGRALACAVRESLRSATGTLSLSRLPLLERRRNE